MPARYLRALLKRGTLIWLLARAMAVVIWAYAQSMGGRDLVAAAGAGTVSLAPWVVAIAPALLLLDLLRRKERMLLHNLGVTLPAAVGVAWLPAVLLEAILLLTWS